MSRGFWVGVACQVGTGVGLGLSGWQRCGGWRGCAGRGVLFIKRCYYRVYLVSIVGVGYLAPSLLTLVELSGGASGPLEVYLKYPMGMIAPGRASYKVL